jgi:hypothetical protein
MVGTKTLWFDRDPLVETEKERSILAFWSLPPGGKLSANTFYTLPFQLRFVQCSFILRSYHHANSPFSALII